MIFEKTQLVTPHELGPEEIERHTQHKLPLPTPSYKVQVDISGPYRHLINEAGRFLQRLGCPM